MRTPQKKLKHSGSTQTDIRSAQELISESTPHKVRPTIFEFLTAVILEEEATGAEGEGLETVSCNGEGGRGQPGEYRDGIFDLIAVIYNWREIASIVIA